MPIHENSQNIATNHNIWLVQNFSFTSSLGKRHVLTMNTMQFLSTAPAPTLFHVQNIQTLYKPTEQKQLIHPHRHSTQMTLNSCCFFSYHLCGKGWSPLSSPLTRAEPAPSGRWPIAWCRGHTGSYTCMVSAWSRHASNHTCDRSRRCRRWWHSSPPSRWLWRTYDLWMEWGNIILTFR